MDFPGLTRRQPVSTVGGRSPVWSRDGRELFYVRTKLPHAGGSADSELVVHAVGPDGTVAAKEQALFRLAPLNTYDTVPFAGYDVAPDGRFLFVQQPDMPPRPLSNRIQIIDYWLEEVRAKAGRQ